MCPEGCPHGACAPRGVPTGHVPRGELVSGRDFSVSLPRAVSPRAAICPGGRGFPRAGFLPGLGSRPAFSIMSLTAPGSSTPELPWREVLRRPYLVRVTLRRLRGIRFFPSNDYHRMHWVAPPVPDTSFSVSLPVSVCPTPEFPWREILQSRTSSKASGDPVFFRRTTRTCSACRSPGSRSTSEFGRSNHSYICIRPQHMWYIQWRQSGQFINAHARWVLQQNMGSKSVQSDFRNYLFGSVHFNSCFGHVRCGFCENQQDNCFTINFTEYVRSPLFTNVVFWAPSSERAHATQLRHWTRHLKYGQREQPLRFSLAFYSQL